MAIQPIQNLLLSSVPAQSIAGGGVTMNATGESCAVIGCVRIAGNPVSKVLSSAGGGSLYFWSASHVMANVGTTFTIGVQDVDLATGFEDGTYDVRGDQIGGSSIINSAGINKIPMTSGTKTISDGQIVAVVSEMVVRAGVDSVQVQTAHVTAWPELSSFSPFPYGTRDVGTLAKSSEALYAFIEFDDGTVGWIQGIGVLSSATNSNVAVTTGTSPDEYIGTFELDWPLQVCGIGCGVSAIVSGDDFELLLYSDPYGTPVVERTVTPDPDLIGASAAGALLSYCAPFTMQPGVYGVALRPTTANAISWEYLNLGTGAIAKDALPLKNLKMAGRDNNTGAFTEIDVTFCPQIVLEVCGLDDGAGGGGGASAYAFA